MEDWLQPQASSTSQQRFQEPDQPDCLSGYHHWYATSHARPTYCNVCREALSGVTSHGLSCEVCKCKVHKRCSIKAINNCKWTTLASVGREIIEDQDGIITMPHQWIEGNLPVSSKCIICEKTCGSVLRLQDWRCLWCRGTVHTACRPLLDPACPLGPARVSVVPPTALHCIQDEAWDVIRPQASSPLLVFVNSKSGENQGVKFLRRFKQLLNPAQVFDLIPSGPRIGLRLFRHFDPFRILICSGDGSVGWVLSEIDKLDMQKQCQIAVLPLGTGNDLSRVLGWGSSCDDDTHLPQLLEKYERASTKMLDRWSIMTFERTYSMPKLSLTNSQIDIEIPFTTTAIMQYEESLISYLHNILQSDEPTVVLNSVKYLYTSVKNFVVQVSESPISKDCKHLSTNCDVLQQKLESLLETLTREEVGFVNYERDQTVDIVTKVQSEHSESGSEKLEKDISNIRESKRSQKVFIQREELVSRANSLKKAIHELVTQTEQAVQKQNVQMESIQETSSGKKHFRHDSKEMDTLKVMPTIEVPSNNEPSSVPRSRSQSLMSARLTSISPLPDFHRDSVCEETNSLLTLPVPTEFADSRRSSGVAAEVQGDTDGRLLTTLGLPEFVSNEEKLYPEQRIDSITQIDKSTKVVESGDVVSPDSVVEEQDNSNIKNDYFDDKECSSILSAISNEEVSIASEILDQKSFCPRKNSDGEDINGHIYHIDSPEMSETYLNSEALQGESLMDDIGSLLCQDAFFNMAGFDQDSIDTSYTDDTTLFTSDAHDNKKDREIKNRSFKQKHIEDIETQFGFENRAFMTQNKFLEKDNRCDDQKLVEPIKYCSLAHFVEGNDIARKSFKRGRQKSTKVIKTEINMNRQSTLTEESEALSNIKLELKQTSYASDTPNEKQDSEIANSIEMICPPKDSEDPNTNPTFPAVSVVVEPPSPVHSGDVCTEQFNQISNMTSEFNLSTNNMNELSIKSSSQYDLGKDDFLRNYLSPYSTTSSQHSSNSNLLGIDLDQLNFLKGSPAATRRISSGSLLKANEVAALAASASSMHSGSKECISDKRDRKDDKEEKKKEIKKTLPIINPLVRLPTWPNVNCGAGFIEKCLLANADALCAAVSPLMDPDETLLEGFIERCVMNNYFGIGIDAKISLDFHNKREEHPEKCRSRAKNYMWYGVLGSKQWLQRTYRNLEQRVQLECDGTRIPLPSLQGIVILNIPSFMGGTNFWGGRKENDCFLAPSFDDRILEVVAVFGSVQMAASRLINLQHHRIAQCQTVQINILGDEGVPVQVDGEAWVQPPGMIRIIHKNRMQMLCRNRSLESSLKTWEEKQRNNNSTASSSISSQLARSNVTFLRQSSQFLTTNIHEKSQRNSLTGKITPLINIEKPPPIIFVHSSEPEIEFSEDESELLLNFIECSTTLVKWVKILAISHINIDVDVYSIAMKTETCLENIHPNGKILEGEDLRIEFTKLVDVIKHLYEECCCLLRDKGHLLKLREDLESKLSVALANMEMELRKCTIVDTSYGSLMYLQPIQDEQSERKNRKGLFWLKFRTGKTVSGPKEGQAKDVVSWGTHEVATWLDMLQMSEYIDSFTKNDIRGRELLTLARRDLKDLGVTKVGHVKRILQAIKDLNQG